MGRNCQQSVCGFLSPRCGQVAKRLVIVLQVELMVVSKDFVLEGAWHGRWLTPELSDPAHRTGRLQLKRESRVR
jgi:hypothetical protein